MKDEYLIIHKSVLPDFYDQVLEAKTLVEANECTISDACKRVGISRSTFYKYKDYVFDVSNNDDGRRIIIGMFVEHKKGILSNILNEIANLSGNILAINQDMPIHNDAYVTMTIDIIEIGMDMNNFVKKLNELTGVRNTQLIAIE